MSLPDSSLSDLNRMYDAWIPVESTRRVLHQAANTEEVVSIPAEQTIRPRLAMSDTQVNTLLPYMLIIGYFTCGCVQ